ncbi:lysostaphin resistance A-like protein [Peptococcus simiae]|uniref:Lysostaphin resistance A-like protein n=1 Tax=Peptococcus simiae TaxID=1643805 RepID=A0ABW9H0T2_9FIRM
MIRKQTAYLALAIGLYLFNQLTMTLFFGPLAPYADRICSDPNFIGVLSSVFQILVYTPLFFFLFKGQTDGLASVHQPRAMLSPHQVFLIALGLSGLTGVWLALVENHLVAFPAIKKSFAVFMKAMEGGSDDSLVLGLLYSTLLAALMEELLFRGLIHNSLKAFSRSPAFAIIATGILFGIWHALLVQSIYAVLGGLIFSYIYERTGRLSVTMAIHFINNFISSMVPELAKVFPPADQVYEGLTLAAIPFLFYYLVKIRPARQTRPSS